MSRLHGRMSERGGNEFFPFWARFPILGGLGNQLWRYTGLWNKPSGPGGSTRRLHQIPDFGSGRVGVDCQVFGGETGSTQVVKTCPVPGMVPPLSGHDYSCQRQLCSGQSCRLMRSRD